LDIYPLDLDYDQMVRYIAMSHRALQYRWPCPTVRNP
jgi:hypothetical protein